MKFTISSKTLQKQLSTISGIVNSNSVIDAIKDLKFVLSANILTATGTDLETTMCITIPVNDGVDGECCIPVDTLMNYLKAMPETPLSFEVNEKHSILITAPSGKYTIQGFATDNFPKMQLLTDAHSFTVASIDMVDFINRTIPFLSNDTLRPELTGVLFSLSSFGINYVSTNSMQLCQIECPTIGLPESSFIVAKKALQQLKSALPLSDVQLNCNVNDSQFSVEVGSLFLSSRLIDARYPDYKAVMPTENKNVGIVSKDGLLAALRRMGVFANDVTNAISLDFSANTLIVETANIEKGKAATETMPCSYDGEPIKIGFNAKQLSEIAGNIQGENISIKMSTPTRAVLLLETEESEKEKTTMVLMPLMIGV